MDQVAATLSSLGAAAFKWSAIAFVLMNGLAVAAIFVTRDRSIVNRWTSKLLFANVLLIGTGIGIPILAKTATFVVQAVSMSAVDAVKPLEPRQDK